MAPHSNTLATSWQRTDSFEKTLMLGKIEDRRRKGQQRMRWLDGITNSWHLLKLMPLSRWWHPTVTFSVVPFSSCLQSFPASGSFPMSQFFASGGQSIGVSASASVLPMNIQDWFPLGWTGWISLQSKGLSRVVSNTTVWKHKFSSTQPSLWSDSHIHTWLLEKTIALTRWTFVGKVISLLFNAV